MALSRCGANALAHQLDIITMRRTLLLSSLYVFALTLLALPYGLAA